MRYDRTSWLDQLVGVCLSLLVGAAALYIAARLIESVWLVLVLALGLIVAVMVGWRIVRYCRDGW